MLAKQQTIGRNEPDSHGFASALMGCIVFINPERGVHAAGSGFGFPESRHHRFEILGYECLHANGH